MKKMIAVAGIIKNSKQQILIAKRQEHQFMAGYWELPGGKVKIGESESSLDAIIREMYEELGIKVAKAKLRLNIFYRYPDRVLDIVIFEIIKYSNTPYSKEGQEISWVDKNKLNNYKLLPTMDSIINTLNLPDIIWITPEINESYSHKQLLLDLEQKLIKDIKLIQLRTKKNISAQLIKKAYKLCKKYNANLILNNLSKDFNNITTDGLHLTSAELMSLEKRPIALNKILAAAVHNIDELKKAHKIQLDFVLLSAIKKTTSHKNIKPIGWDKAKKLIKKAKMPVYLLGGMSRDDLKKAKKYNAQGIAGISKI